MLHKRQPGHDNAAKDGGIPATQVERGLTEKKGVLLLDLAAAIRRFPARARAIEELAARDEAFCSLCFDFRDAETALHQWANSDSPKRDQRCAEYSELIDYLAREVESALDEAAIIPIGRSRPKPR